MAVLAWVSVLTPVLVAAFAFARRRAGWTRFAALGASGAVLGCSVAMVVQMQQRPPVLAGLLRVDALSAYVLLAVGAVALTSTWAGSASTARADGWLSALVCLFIAMMSLAVLADNLGVMWVAIEATTITTAFLVGYRGGRNAAEAAWKYVVIGSAGVATALLGIVLIYASGANSNASTLSWTSLMSDPTALDGNLVRIGTALAALGLATKAGLAPMHTWLPDAHSQAPPAVSGLMSGVLVSVAFAGILRIQAIGDAVLGPGLMRGLLLGAGLLSLLVAATLMLTQRDYKRLLAYSTIEHMGILALGAGVGGPVALAAVLLHILGHGLTKAVLFVTAGRLPAVDGVAAIAGVRHLLHRQPAEAVAWLTGMAALAGFPPSVLFFTEVVILTTGYTRGLGWVMAVALGLLLVAVAALARHALVMCLGTGADTVPEQTPGQAPLETGRRAASSVPAPIVLALVVVALAGFAWPARPVLTDAAAVLSLAVGAR